eukprot:4090906-Alexandrium_andersonii.AAC.1
MEYRPGWGGVPKAIHTLRSRSPDIRTIPGSSLAHSGIIRHPNKEHPQPAQNDRTIIHDGGFPAIAPL